MAIIINLIIRLSRLYDVKIILLCIYIYRRVKISKLLLIILITITGYNNKYSLHDVR